MRYHSWLWVVLFLLCAGPLWAYTRTWNELAPSDGSAANLLGQVIRQHKQDIRERLQTCLNIGTPTDTGLPKITTCWNLIGPDASKPASPKDGQLYFSTDAPYNRYLAYGGTWNNFDDCQTPGCTFSGSVTFAGTMPAAIDARSGTFTISALTLLTPSVLDDTHIRNAGIEWYNPVGVDGRIYWNGTEVVFCAVDTGVSTHLTPGSATLTTATGGC